MHNPTDELLVLAFGSIAEFGTIGSWSLRLITVRLAPIGISSENKTRKGQVDQLKIECTFHSMPPCF